MDDSKDKESSCNIPGLIERLCEIELGTLGSSQHAQQKNPLQWQKTRSHSKRLACRRAWDTLMKQLPGPHCMEEPPVLQNGLGEVEQIYALAFDLRQQRQFDKASHLENLVESLLKVLPDKTLCKSLLHILLELRNHGKMDTVSVVGHQNKVPIGPVTQQEPVSLPAGPLMYGDTQQCIYRHSYMHYPSHVFELPGIGHQELRNRDRPSMTEIFAATPGKHLFGNGVFEPKGCLNDNYEKSMHSSLYGALVRSTTSSVNLMLDLPDLSESTQPPDIQIPKLHVDSDDEGFVETLSSSRGATLISEDTGYGPGPNDGEIWEKALTFVPCKHRVWENQGRLPQWTERPFLTEVGPGGLDHLWLIHMEHLCLIDSSIEIPVRRRITMDALICDVINVLLGVPSTSFILDETMDSFCLATGLHISGLTPEGITEACQGFIECSTNYRRLAHFSDAHVDSFHCSGLIFQAFAGAIRKLLQHYRGCILTIPCGKTLMQVNVLLQKVMLQIRFLAELCHCAANEQKPAGDKFPTGVHLLSYLYQETLEVASTVHYPMMLSLLSTTCGPYLVFVQNWVFDGVCQDMYKEYMIEVNADYLEYRDKHYWTHGYRLIADRPNESVPLFLAEFANDIFVCGKSINLLKLCAPVHFLFMVDQEQPRVQVTFSEHEISSIESTCQKYLSRMLQIARMRTKTRQQIEERAEQARQDLMIQARQAAAQELHRLQAIAVEQEKAEDARKRKLFSELKEQMLQDVQKRSLAQEQQKEEDKVLVDKAIKQEILGATVDQQLERQTREELIDYYGKLSAEASLREQRALWKVRRSRLDLRRQDFLQTESNLLQKELTKHLEDDVSQHLPKWSKTSPSAVRSPGNTLPRWAQKGLPSIEQSHMLELEFANSGPENTAESPVPEITNLEIISDNQVIEDVAAEADIKVKADVSVSVVGDIMKSEPAEKVAIEPTTYVGPLVSEATGVSHPSVSSIQTLMYTEPTRREDINVTKIVEGSQKDVANNFGETVIKGEATDVTAEISQGAEDRDTLVQSGDFVRADVSPMGHESQIHLIDNQHISTESMEDMPTRPGIKMSTDSNVLTESQPTQDRMSVKGIDQRHVSAQSEAPEDTKPHIKLSQTRHATSESVEAEQKSHLKTVGDIHVNTESTYQQPKPLVKMSSSMHPSQQSAIVTDKPIKRNFFGHVSELSREDPALNIPKLKTFQDQHASKESDFFSYQIKPHRRKRVEQLSVETESTEQVYRPKIRMDVTQHASKQSDLQPDLDEVRLMKFKKRNAVGHSSDSSVQRLLYGGNVLPEFETEVTTKDVDDVKWMDAAPVEPYDDKFDNLNDPPVVDLTASLDSFLLGNIGDYGISLSPDIEAHSFLSLPALLKRSVTAPLIAQISLVNQSIVSHFISELHMDSHLKALRHYMLMRDGEFGQSLSDQLFEKLATNPKVHEVLNPMFLNHVLSKALRASMQGNTAYAQNLAFVHKYLPDVLNYNAPNVLDCVNLTYKVTWPMNIVITENSLVKYSRVFSFMLQLKRAVWILKDVWHKLKRDALIHKASGGSQFRQLHLYRHEMQFFVRVMQEYIANQVIHVTWKEFKEDLANNVHNLDDLHTCHGDYLNKCLSRCLLNQKAAPVMKIIQDIFGLILTFRSQLKSHSWQRNSDTDAVTHPMFDKMCATYNSFNDYSRFLFKVVRKLAIKGYLPHLQELLLRLNYNHHYSTDG